LGIAWRKPLLLRFSEGFAFSFPKALREVQAYRPFGVFVEDCFLLDRWTEGF
jgi:hypothetical protein